MRFVSSDCSKKLFQIFVFAHSVFSCQNNCFCFLMGLCSVRRQIAAGKRDAEYANSFSCTWVTQDGCCVSTSFCRDHRINIIIILVWDGIQVFSASSRYVLKACAKWLLQFAICAFVKQTVCKNSQAHFFECIWIASQASYQRLRRPKATLGAV